MNKIRVVFLNIDDKFNDIVQKMINEDFISNPDTYSLSLRALGLKIKSISVINGETVAYVEDNNNLLLG